MRPEELGFLAGLKAPPNRSAGSEECCGGSCNGWDPEDTVDSSLLGVAFHIENKNRLRALPEGQHDPLHLGHRIAHLDSHRQTKPDQFRAMALHLRGRSPTGASARLHAGYKFGQFSLGAEMPMAMTRIVV